MVDPYEAELAEQAASGGSGSTLGGGFNFSGSSGSSNISTSSDDGGDSQNFTSGVVYDQQGNVKNPYPNSFFSRIFGANNVSYQNIIPQNTLNKLGGLAEQRFNNPQMAVNRGFGALFGGAEGEMTIAGPRTAGVRPQTFTEGVGGLLAGLVVPGGGMLERAGRTVYAPEGYLPEGYEQPEGGLLEQFLGGFGGLLQPEPETVGRAVGQARDTAASLVDRARQGITSVLKDPVADDMVASVSRPRGELSQTVSGGRFEDESARPQTPTPRQESLTFDGSIQNSLRQSQNTNNPFIEQGLVNPRKVSTQIYKEGDVMREPTYSADSTNTATRVTPYEGLADSVTGLTDLEGFPILSENNGELLSNNVFGKFGSNVPVRVDRNPDGSINVVPVGF